MEFLKKLYTNMTKDVKHFLHLSKSKRNLHNKLVMYYLLNIYSSDLSEIYTALNYKKKKKKEKKGIYTVLLLRRVFDRMNPFRVLDCSIWKARPTRFGKPPLYVKVGSYMSLAKKKKKKKILYMKDTLNFNISTLILIC